MKKKLSIIALFVLLTTVVSAQKIGVRGGLNYATVKGPENTGEKFGFNNGFHFGISYAYEVSDMASIRAEIAYFQTGYSYDFNGESFFVFQDTDKTTIEKGALNMNIENSLGYLSIPVVANLKVTPKLHLHAGGYVNFLVNPLGAGQLRFESSTRPEDIKFRQGLDYKYKTDGYWKEAKKRFARYVNPNAAILIDGEKFIVPRFAGAYAQYNNLKNGNYYNTLDAGVTFGAEYFLTKGFFAGLSVDYGLMDITNNNVDYDRSSVNEDNTFKYSDDFDRLVSYKLSIGFRF